MEKLVFVMSKFWDEAYQILHMKRGEQLRLIHPLIVLETLRTLGDQRPTRDQLQKLSRIRRRQFIIVLKDLLTTEAIVMPRT